MRIVSRPRRFPVGIAAAQILVGQVPHGRGRLVLSDVVGGVVARADAREHVTGATASVREVHLAVPGDHDAPGVPLDAGLQGPRPRAGAVDAQPVVIHRFDGVGVRGLPLNHPVF